MAKQTDETGLRPLALVAAGLAFWVVAGGISGWTLRRHPESAALRGAMVALAVAGFLSWLIPVARLILLQDEFSQRIHLVAIALACGATAVLVFTADLLQTAGFLGWVSLQSVWMLMGVLWWLGIFVATRYYNK